MIIPGGTSKNCHPGCSERWGNQLSIGFTDLGGNLDILAHLRGTQQLLIDLVDLPQEIDRLVRETNQLWLQCYEALYALTSLGCGITCWGPCWSPRRGYLLQSDFSYMISPLMFERYVLPDLAACCEALDYAFYHLDGKGQLPHLDMLLALERLRGIQWVPGDGQPQAEHWLPPAQSHPPEWQALPGIRKRTWLRSASSRELGGKGLALVINESANSSTGESIPGRNSLSGKSPYVISVSYIP